MPSLIAPEWISSLKQNRWCDDADEAGLKAVLKAAEILRADDEGEFPSRPSGPLVVLEGKVELYRGSSFFASMETGQVVTALMHWIESLPIHLEMRASPGTVVAHFPQSSVSKLIQQNCGLALSLVSCFGESVAHRLHDVALKRPDWIDEYFRNDGKTGESHMIRVELLGRSIEVQSRVQCGDLLPESIDDFPVVGAIVDGIICPLSSLLTSDCEVGAVTTATREGRRMKRRSLGLLMLEAASEIDPSLQARIGPNFGEIFLLELEQDASIAALKPLLEEKARELVGQCSPLQEEEWTAAEARRHFEALGAREELALLRFVRDRHVPVCSYGKIKALGDGFLADTGAIGEFELISSRRGIIVVPKDPQHPQFQVEGARSAEEAVMLTSAQILTMREGAELQSRMLGIASVGELNEAVVEGRIEELIALNEGAQEKRVAEIADRILSSETMPRIVCIAGPSSSGKTTFCKRLSLQLKVAGISPIPLSLDDYFLDRRETPRKPDGDYDYECLEALNLELLHEHLQRLLCGETVKTASYDFKTGVSAPEGGKEISLNSGIVVLEGLHGLNPKLLADVPVSKVFRVFICPIGTLRIDRVQHVGASDLRLIRRIVRDRRHRGASAADSIRRWDDVRQGERRHIFPFQHHADAIFDSALLYELAVLKVFVERDLLEVSFDDPMYPWAYYLLRQLDHVIGISDTELPPNSILREFIG